MSTDVFTPGLHIESVTSLQIEWRLGALAQFSPANPTGSYVLNLSADVDFSLACRLLTCWGVETRQGICKASDLQVRLC